MRVSLKFLNFFACLHVYLSRSFFPKSFSISGSILLGLKEVVVRTPKTENCRQGILTSILREDPPSCRGISYSE